MATSAGFMLANAGLLGNRRGSWGGIAEGTGGGALVGAGIGMQFGGPEGAAIGAGIGAAAGLGIGLAEKALGLLSPEEEAKKQAKSVYGITISTAMANQIVGIAQSKYGGTKKEFIQLAVRDPSTRQMLQLYATGTGQKFPMLASTPQAGSLSESGGKLYQNATYPFGNPYTFQSSLPVAGGFATGQYPSSPGSVTLNVNGQSAADLLEGRIASTVTPGYVQDQYSSALASSNGRLANSAAIQQPGLITS